THHGAHVTVSGRGARRGEAVLALAAQAEAGGDGPALRAWLVIWQRPARRRSLLTTWLSGSITDWNWRSNEHGI
ncbi:MAG TPA: hypothetical protein VMG13_24955, partial [Trebonia sp.]|nr:hypothetical protein [Trebonia sp.]